MTHGDDWSGHHLGSHDYWLANCEGFRVEGSGGRLGVVGAMRCERSGAVEALIVVGGLLGNRMWIVPVDDVAVVQPRRQRVGLVEKPTGVHLLAREEDPHVGRYQVAPC